MAEACSCSHSIRTLCSCCVSLVTTPRNGIRRTCPVRTCQGRNESSWTEPSWWKLRRSELRIFWLRRKKPFPKKIFVWSTKFIEILSSVRLTCDCSDIKDVEAAAVVRFSGPLLMPIIFSFGESANPCKTGSDVLCPCWSRGISACAEEITLISSPLQPVLLMPSPPLW